MSLRDKIVLITGASSGIGAALARELAARGAHLVLTARRIDKLEELAAELRPQGVQVLCVSADVTRDGELEHAVARATAELGGLDVAVANAGFGVEGLLSNLTVEDVRRQMETNLFGVLRTFYATRSALIARHGVLAMVGSVAGFVSLPGSIAYSMSKFAVRALAEGLCAELHRDGVAVVHIVPGFIDSDIRRIDNRGELHPHARDPVPRWLRMPGPEAARQIADAIAARRAKKVITHHGKLAVALSQHAHGLVDAVLRRLPVPRRREKR
jgi:short-subunit dehydrogenase